ncbi:MAG: hypothetical protein ABIH42_11385, partial [Planctomycetota bacterium]
MNCIKRLILLFLLAVLISNSFSCGPFGAGPWYVILSSIKTKKETAADSLPDKVSFQDPVNQTDDIPVDITISWNPAKRALSYDIYFGIEKSAVENADKDSAEYIDNFTESSFDPSPEGSLTYNTTYYWRIDSVNSYGTTKGDTWHFKTVNPPMDPPEKVTNLFPTNSANGVEVNVTFSWL